MKKFIFPCFLVFLLAVFGQAELTSVKNLDIAGDKIKLLEIDCGHVSLKIKGVENQKNISVEAKALSDGLSESEVQEFISKNAVFALNESGNKAVLKCDIAETALAAKDIDLTLIVSTPLRINLDIVAGLKGVNVKNIMGDVVLEGGSGKIVFSNIGGDIELTGGYGGTINQPDEQTVFYEDEERYVVFRNIGGRIHLHDESGKTTIGMSEDEDFDRDFKFDFNHDFDFDFNFDHDFDFDFDFDHDFDFDFDYDYNYDYNFNIKPLTVIPPLPEIPEIPDVTVIVPKMRLHNLEALHELQYIEIPEIEIPEIIIPEIEIPDIKIPEIPEIQELPRHYKIQE